MMRSSSSRPLVQVLERRFLLSTVTYNRSAAVAYAQQYANEVVGDGYFWINSGSYNYYGAGAAVPVNQASEASGIGDDCAHFVSSCIGTPTGGGGGGLSIASRVPPTYGEPGAAALDQLLLTDGYATQVSSVSQLQPGDVIGYDWDGGSKISGIDHTVIYMGNNLICAHSTSHYDVNYNSLGSGTVFYFHINTAGPGTPTNSSPANSSVVTTTAPKLTASAFSESGATQTAAEWQIYNGSTMVYDSGTDTTDKTSITVPSGKLASGNTYTWKVRYEDNYGSWSSYSSATSFAINTSGPNTPTNVLPTDGSNVGNPVVLSSGAFTDTQSGATHTASEWIVLNSGNATVFDSGADTSDLFNVTVPSIDLTTNSTYTWEVRYKDSTGVWGGYSVPTSFTVVNPSVLTLAAAPAYYLQDTAGGQYLNIWNATTNTGTPNQSVQLGTISKIIMDGASTGSNFTIDFANGSPAPQNRITIIDAGNSANNSLTVLGSASGNDTISAAGGQITVNSTLTTYSAVGAVTYIPGAASDAFTLSSGALNLGGSGSFSNLSILSGASLNIGGFTATVLDSGTTESSIQSMLAAGEITSNLVTSDATNTTAIGYFDNGSQVAIRATWKGDANLDGVVNADDLSLMMLGQSQNKSDWQSGNFNNSAQVNADDWMDFYYALAYSAGRSYSSVFAGAALQSAQDMNQILSPANQAVLA